MASSLTRYGSKMCDVTQILSQIESGDPSAAEQLLPLVYDELRKLAATRLAQEKPGQTLQATALVHEAYIRLVGNERSQTSWVSRGHFFGAAAQAMRRILIDNAKRKARERHGGGLRRKPLADLNSAAPSTPDELLAIDDALQSLERKDPAKAELVKLRFYAGLTVEQAANALGISTSTADRQWTYARAWLYRELTNSDPSHAD